MCLDVCNSFANWEYTHCVCLCVCVTLIYSYLCHGELTKGNNFKVKNIGASSRLENFFLEK